MKLSQCRVGEVVKGTDTTLEDACCEGTVGHIMGFRHCTARGVGVLVLWACQIENLTHYPEDLSLLDD